MDGAAASGRIEQGAPNREKMSSVWEQSNANRNWTESRSRATVFASTAPLQEQSLAKEMPHTHPSRVRPTYVFGGSAARDVQAGHHDERQVGQSEKQRRRENALTRVLHMFPSSSAQMRNSTEVTPPNVHLSAERVSRPFSNVWPAQGPTTSIRLDVGEVDACSPRAPLQSLPKRDQMIAGHRASQPSLVVASV